MNLSPKKLECMKKLLNEDNIIAALAIDQRGSIKKMMAKTNPNASENDIVEFKKLISEYLSEYSSAILLDPEYGLPASQLRKNDCGLIFAYEKTGYDASKVGRLPDLLDYWSVRKLQEATADAIKILLYYDVDESAKINDVKKTFVERVGDECNALDIPFFLEIVSYDAKIETKSKDYAVIKPHKVNGAMKVFCERRYNVDVLKVEVPVNMKFVEGYTNGEVIHTKKDAMNFFKEQSDISTVPFIFLSAGVSQELFQETLYLAKESASQFNGVLCGRATWANAVDEYAQSSEKAIEWLKIQGKKNITSLNMVLKETATPWCK